MGHDTVSLTQWFLTFWRNTVSTQPGDSLTYMQLLFPGPLTVRRATSMLRDDRGYHSRCSAWTGSGCCPPCSLSTLLIASLMLSPLRCTGFEPFGHWWVISLTWWWAVPLSRPWSYTLTPPTPSWLADNLSVQLLPSNTASVSPRFTLCLAFFWDLFISGAERIAFLQNFWSLIHNHVAWSPRRPESESVLWESQILQLIIYKTF